MDNDLEDILQLCPQRRVPTVKPPECDPRGKAAFPTPQLENVAHYFE